MACAVSGVKLYDAYIMGDTMAISRDKLLKDLLPGLNDLFKYGADYLKQVDQVIANEAAKLQANKLEDYRIKQAGKTFRNDVKVAQIIANEEQSARYKKELEDAVQKQNIYVE
jgi:tRNA nucleotidyltransferase/poly(A) polymerase